MLSHRSWLLVIRVAVKVIICNETIEKYKLKYYKNLENLDHINRTDVKRFKGLYGTITYGKNNFFYYNNQFSLLAFSIKCLGK